MAQYTVRVIRVIEIIGPREWVQNTLDRSFIIGNKATAVLGPGRSMTELARTAPEPWLAPRGVAEVPRG